MHNLSTEFNQPKLLSMFIVAVFSLLQAGLHVCFRFLFPLFRLLRSSYSCPSIERNTSRIHSGFHNGFKIQSDRSEDISSHGLMATEVVLRDSRRSSARFPQAIPRAAIPPRKSALPPTAPDTTSLPANKRASLLYVSNGACKKFNEQEQHR